MKKRKVFTENFLGVLTRNYTIFSLIVVLALVSVFLIANYITGQDSFFHMRKTILSYEDLLYERNFDGIPFKKLFGSDGWFCVTATSGSLIYGSDDDVPSKFTVGELDAISHFDTSEKIDVKMFTSTSGEKQYLISKSFSNGSADQFILLNSTYRILSGTAPTTKVQYTEREFIYLTYNFYNEYHLFKYNFTADDGNHYTAVFLDTVGYYNNVSDIILGISILASILLYIVLLTFFIIYTNKKVKQPLTALDNAMQSLNTAELKNLKRFLPPLTKWLCFLIKAKSKSRRLRTKGGACLRGFRTI